MTDLDINGKYWKITEELRDAVKVWYEILNDPYKPPELKTGLPSNIGTLCFKQAACYYALCNTHEFIL